MNYVRVFEMGLIRNWHRSTEVNGVGENRNKSTWVVVCKRRLMFEK
jgi:hypothetical protein